MKKVLIIARDFPPYCNTLGGVLRVLKLAEFLAGRGIEVRVLAAKGEPISYYGYEELVRSLDVTYLDDRLQPAINRITSSASRSAARRVDEASRTFRLLKRAVNEFSVPDVGVFFAGKFVREASRMIREHGIRNVYVTSPPPSTLLAGLALKRRFGDRIRFFADYRDSWTSRHEIARKGIGLVNRVNAAMERRVLRAADRFVHVSSPMLEGLEEGIAGLREKSVLVMNGFDAAMVESGPAPGPANPCLHLGHFGRFTGREPHKSPEPLFRILEAMGGRIRLFLYGETSLSAEWVERLRGIAEIRGNLPHREAIRAMRGMDLLLIYHTDPRGAKEIVTGKLFEYMVAERPVLVLGPPGMEAARIVREEGIGYAVDVFDTAAVEAALRRLLEEWKAGALVRYDVRRLEQYSRQHQYGKILPLLV